nr:PREDICTED: uncharacterized protein LOC109042639 [Bemisia tabaci]XP_018915059.1 PREDICTED: uncharacterized protein LOC109042639 [Bemisia tabaci]
MAFCVVSLLDQGGDLVVIRNNWLSESKPSEYCYYPSHVKNISPLLKKPCAPTPEWNVEKIRIFAKDLSSYEDAFKKMLFFMDHSGNSSNSDDGKRKVPKPRRYRSDSECENQPAKKSRKAPAKTSQAVSQGALPSFPDVPETSFIKEHRPPLADLTSNNQLRHAPTNSTTNCEDAINVEVIIPDIDLFRNTQNSQLEDVNEIDNEETIMDFVSDEFASQNFRNNNDEDRDLLGTFQQVVSPLQSLENSSTPEGVVSHHHEQPVMAQPPPERPSNSFVGPYGHTQVAPTPDDVRASTGTLSEEEVRELYQLNAQQLMIKMIGNQVRMFSRIEALQKDINYIKASFDSKEKPAANNQVTPVDLKTIYPDLPCSSAESLDGLDTHLKSSSQDERRKFFQGLRQIGGSNAGDMIRGMLLRIVRNAVAKQYSFQGKGEGNKKFDKYLIVSMMLSK